MTTRKPHTERIRRQQRQLTENERPVTRATPRQNNADDVTDHHRRESDHTQRVKTHLPLQKRFVLDRETTKQKSGRSHHRDQSQSRLAVKPSDQWRHEIISAVIAALIVTLTQKAC